jgi:hypothetical protein
MSAQPTPSSATLHWRRDGLALARLFAIGAAFATIRPPPRETPKGKSHEKGADRRNFLLIEQVPEWLSPKEKLRPPSATCAAATTR